MLPPAKRAEALEGVDLEQLAFQWSFWARPSQYIPHETPQARVLLLGGRGSGQDPRGLRVGS